MTSSVVGSFAPAKMVTSKKFTLVEIADCRVKGICFRCDEEITPGHKEKCKRLFIIEVLDEEEEDGMSTISLHALTGVHSSSSSYS
jgi:hypothetical protein